MKKLLYSVFLCCVCFLPLEGAQKTAYNEEVCVKRIHAHLLIKDYTTASAEARQAILDFPHSKLVYEALIRALAEEGNEQEMLAAWQSYTTLYPDESLNRPLIEAMAWAVITRGCQSPSPVVRLIALLGAFFGNDAKSVHVIKNQLRSLNSAIRGAAVKLASHLHDAVLCDEIFRVFKEENVWAVKLEATRAVGKMKIQAAKPYLIDIIADDKRAAEEKAAAIESLVSLLETMERKEIFALTQSNRSGLRQLACEIIAHFHLNRDADLMIPLLKDSRPEVKVAALSAIGTLRLDEINGVSIPTLVAYCLQDSDSRVGITSAWALTLYEPYRGQQALNFWLNHDSRRLRILAASALASTGKYGLPLMLKAFEVSDDLYVRMNLAIGLITQTQEVQKACEVLFEGLSQLHDNWTWEYEGNFRLLVPHKFKHREENENPKAENQIVRLEVLSILAMMKHPKAQNAINQFLKEQTWEVTGIAVALLLTEGDEIALQLVREQLQDPKICVQAALVLALWGSDEAALQVLQKTYGKADYEMKMRILEGLGRVGAQSSIPFLIDCLGEAYQTLRIIASCALVQTLNK